MKIKDLKIGVLLKLGFGAMMLLVIGLGVISYVQSGLISDQTEIIFDHPLKVRKAIGQLNADILSARVGERDQMLALDENARQEAVELMELSVADAQQQFNMLYDSYLGPRKDIDEAHDAFVIWNTNRQENVKLLLAGDLEKAIRNMQSSGKLRACKETLMAKIKVVDDFAVKKSETLYAVSEDLNRSLNWNLLLLVLAILLLTLLINYVLLRNIRRPLDELTGAAQHFSLGDMNARSSYISKNEFGTLSGAFNVMVESIQLKTDLDRKVANLASLMLSEYDIKKFFQSTLNALAAHTGSQMAAIYLLSNDKKTFEHFESLGLDDSARQSFSAVTFEGEFGSVLASRKMQHLENIPGDTRFVFNSVSGKFLPKEILTLPILADNEVIAIISLAGIGKYSKQSIQLVDSILVTLCARIEGIIGYHKVKEILMKLEYQNRELESQKTELAMQSAELTEQNTELEMQKKQLSEASELKTNFLSNMSHELRTPLNSVIALSGVLNRRLAAKIPDEEYSYLEVIERNGKHLLSLINDILDISRIESGREEIEISRFNVNGLVTDVINLILPQAQQKNIELRQTAPGSDVFMTTDFDKFHHILQNLISNAVKFTDEGRVEVSAVKTGDTVSVSVADTGIGISANHLPHIFDEFRQADGSTSRRYGGTGLGLAIAKKYANLLGGNVTVKSSPGSGSVFTISLPTEYAAENQIMELHSGNYQQHALIPPKIKQESHTALKTILLVDDSEPAIIQLRDILEDCGCRILVAHDGGEALAVIDHTIPDAMVLDLMMPGIDGFEVLRTLREAEPTAHIPVLILTAKHITKDELRFLKRNNVHQLIQKGDVNRGELLSAIETMVFPVKVENQVPFHRELQTITGKPSILVVEDNPDNMLTARALLADDFIVIEALDGNTGVALARKHKPNLILMDIALPGIDGIEAFKAIRGNGELQHIPIVALTASAMTSDRETILSYGFDAYIAKPIEQKQFFKTINEVLYGN